MIVCETETCPLTYMRPINGVLTKGLSVTVVVTNARTGAQLLASTAVPEVGSSSGIYTYNWTHGLIAETLCIATYTAGGRVVQEDVLIKFSGYPGRGA